MIYETPESCQRVAICDFLTHAAPATIFAVAEAVFPGDHMLVQRQLDTLRHVGIVFMPDWVSYALTVRIEGVYVMQLDSSGIYTHEGASYSIIPSTHSDPVLTFWTYVQEQIDKARKVRFRP